MEIKYLTNIMGEVPREFKAELFDFLENKVNKKKYFSKKS